MSKFIAVRNPNSAPEWTAIQWAETLAQMKAITEYTAGVDEQVSSDQLHTDHGPIQLKEVTTNLAITARIIELLSPTAQVTFTDNFVKSDDSKAKKKSVKIPRKKKKANKRKEGKDEK